MLSIKTTGSKGLLKVTILLRAAQKPLNRAISLWASHQVYVHQHTRVAVYIRVFSKETIMSLK